jgi:hypothetical protein
MLVMMALWTFIGLASSLKVGLMTSADESSKPYSQLSFEVVQLVLEDGWSQAALQLWIDDQQLQIVYDFASPSTPPMHSVALQSSCSSSMYLAGVRL